jgi:predicted AlkP superfamily phosphohydrolase/phosphomutase
LDFLPDILVIWDRMAPIRTVTSPKIGSVDATGLTTDRRTGDHRPAGRFFALAPDWPAQRLNSTVRAEDFAPTIAQILGVEPPDTDGQAISALLKRLPQTDGDDMVLAQPAN